MIDSDVQSDLGKQVGDGSSGITPLREVGTNNAEGLQHSLDLFADVLDGNSTNSIAVYDAAPKYIYRNRERAVTESGFEDMQFSLPDGNFDVTVGAARVKMPDGTEVLIFPGDREQVIEDALRKLAVSGNGVGLNGVVGVVFTLYELFMELKGTKHEMGYSQLREGLYVLRHSSLKITSRSSGESWDENYLSRLVEGGISKNSGGEREYQKWFCSFHLLVTKSIQDISYKMTNYQRLMQIKGLMPKYLYKRMVLVYSYAQKGRPYEPTLLQILTDSGRGISPEMKNNVKAMKRTLDELVKRGVIEWVEEIRQMEGRKLINIRYRIHPTAEFVSECIRANKQQKRLKNISGKRKIRQLITDLPA